MVNCCSVLGCRNKQSSNVSLFYFPKNEYYLKKWIAACGRNISERTANARMCSNHFRPECFKQKSASAAYVDEILNESPKRKRRLVPHAVPTENLNLPSIEFIEIMEPKEENLIIESLEKDKLQSAEIKEENLNESHHSREETVSSENFQTVKLPDENNMLDPKEELEFSLQEASNESLDLDEESNSTIPDFPKCALISDDETENNVNNEIKIKYDHIAKLKKKHEKLSAQLMYEINNLRKENERLQLENDVLKQENKKRYEASVMETLQMKNNEAIWKRKCNMYKVRKEYAENKYLAVSEEKKEILRKLRSIFN